MVMTSFYTNLLGLLLIICLFIEIGLYVMETGSGSPASP